MNVVFYQELLEWSPESSWLRDKSFSVGLFSHWLGFKFHHNCKYDGEKYSLIFLGLIRIRWGFYGCWINNSTGEFLDDIAFRGLEK